MYKKNAAVEQIWVYGNSFESSVVAVVVPVAAKLQVRARAAPRCAALRCAVLC